MTSTHTTHSPQIDEDVDRVLLIFKTHLDVGFTDFAENVIRRYIEHFIPSALQLAEQLRRQGGGERFVWTTGTWLIYEFLERADPSGRKMLEKAIEAGDLVWHALPFTAHSELMDESLFALGLELAKKLDQRFDRKTVAGKMTDVPGHTRAIAPILQKYGISLLHIGVNPASTPPAVPCLFVWRDRQGAEVTVVYSRDYGDVVILPDTHTAFALSFTGDNHGPQTPEQVIKIYQELQLRFPRAVVQASDLNQVALEISRIRAALPVITAEMGDSWIHGAGSDPLLVSQFRQLSRLRKKWLADGVVDFADPVDLAFGRKLATVAEHTWGLDVKTHLQDWSVYKNEDFAGHRSRQNFAKMEKSWRDKREWIHLAVRALPESLKRQAQQALDEVKPLRPVEQFSTGDHSFSFETEHFTFALDPHTGALTSLVAKADGRQWAGPLHPLGLYSYQTFSQAHYDRFMEQYLTHRPDWALQDFGKPGMEIAAPRDKRYHAALQSIHLQQGPNGLRLYLFLAVLDESGVAVIGCPKNTIIEYFLPNNQPVVEMQLRWFDKTATRLPEAVWLSFVPVVQTTGRWQLDKMGEWIDATDVIKDGGRKLHAVQRGVRYLDEKGYCDLETLDAALVAPGECNLLNFDNQLPDALKGTHFCLFNNLWGTNFTMWYDENMCYRFRLYFSS